MSAADQGDGLGKEDSDGRSEDEEGVTPVVVLLCLALGVADLAPATHENTAAEARMGITACADVG